MMAEPLAQLQEPLKTSMNTLLAVVKAQLDPLAFPQRNEKSDSSFSWLVSSD